MPIHINTAESEAREWRRRSAELALACAGSGPADEGLRMRELSILLATAPGGLARGLSRPEPRELEALAGTGATTGAALVVVLRLIEVAGGAYVLSCGNGYLASVALPGAEEEVTASGDTAALAMLGAVSLALSEMDEVHGVVSGCAVPDGARLN
jgi:hypothetical protein